MQFYRKRDGAGLHQEHLVLRYPLVTRLSCLLDALLWNTSLFISLHGQRLWLILSVCILTQLRERGLGRLGK